MAVLDCSARDALAYFFAIGSRENLRISSEQGHPALLVQRLNGLNDVVVAMIKKMPFPLHNREFVNHQVCCSDVNGDLLFITVPVDEVIDYGMKSNTFRAVVRNRMRFIPAGVSQCKVTYHMHVDAGGRIPTFVLNAAIPLALGAVGDLRDAFQRDDEIDKLERDQLARVIKEEPQTYTAEENLLLNKVNVKLGMIEWERFEELESPDHLVRMGRIFIEGSSLAVSRASTPVDSSVEDCAALVMAVMCRDHVKEHVEGGGLERELWKENDHRNLFHGVYDFQIPGFRPREFVTSLVWKRQGTDSLVVASESVEHADFPHKLGYVRGTTTVHWLYEKVQDAGGLPQTRVTWTQHLGKKPTHMCEQMGRLSFCCYNG